jgi:transcriptional regulator with XRE-family HTH domain
MSISFCVKFSESVERITMEIFDIVKKLCDDRDIKLTVLERDLGFSRGSVYKMIDSAPSSDKVKKLADYFNVSADYLLGRTSNENGILGDDMNKNDITYNELLKIYNIGKQNLSPEEKIRLAQIILSERND